MSDLALSLAYKYIAIVLMLADINLCAERLHLKAALPIKEVDAKEIYVAPPRILKFMGAVDTTNYSFGFSESGRLRFITEVQPFGADPLPEIQKRLGKIQTSMTTNEVYSLATNWMEAMSIDVPALEKAYSKTVRQHFYHGQGGHIINLPIYDAFWGRPEKPAVIVTIYAPTKELLQLRQNDESFSKRAPRVLQNIDALLAIPDGEFLKLTSSQRSNLLQATVQKIAAEDKNIKK